MPDFTHEEVNLFVKAVYQPVHDTKPKTKRKVTEVVVECDVDISQSVKNVQQTEVYSAEKCQLVQKMKKWNPMVNLMKLEVPECNDYSDNNIDFPDDR